MRRSQFLKNKMQPADLIALVSLDTELKVDQDFTSDKDLTAGQDRNVQRDRGHCVCAGREC
jgi:hypothetical protein